MAGETEPIHYSEKSEGEKKDNPSNIQSPPEQEDQGLQAADISPTTYPLDQPADLDIVKAKLGVERFKAAYEAGDDEWKHLLTETQLGEGLQAMYLGLKPMCSTEGIPFNDEQILIQNLQRVSIPGFGMCIGQGGQSLAFDANHVTRILTAYSQYFPDYTPETPISTYLMRYTVPFQERTTPRELERRQFGFLYGFPPHAVEQFASHPESYQLTIDLYTAEDLTPEDEAVLLGLNGGSYEDPDSMEEFHDNVNRYAEEHQEEIRALLDRRYPSFDEEAKQYILTARYIGLPGFVYTSGNPNAEDKAFVERIRNIFEKSGMTTYLASVKPGNMH